MVLKQNNKFSNSKKPKKYFHFSSKPNFAELFHTKKTLKINKINKIAHYSRADS